MKIKVLLVAVLSSMMFLNVLVAQAGEHAHFAAFFDNGKNANFAFPSIVVGDNVEQDMLKLGAEMMVFAHSAGIKSGDVWSIQNNTLRDVNGEFEDFGVGCQLMMNMNPMSVGGVCSIYMALDAGNKKTKKVLNTQVIKKELVWHKLFEDSKHGVAGYFMRETAVDFNH